jgi:hypothetical protein
MELFKTLQYTLVSVLVLFFAVSALADPGYYDYGVYYMDGDLGVYYYTQDDGYYNFYHYPHTSYDGVYNDVYFNSSGYHSPYGVHYANWPYGYTVMDNYANYPSYVTPDSYAYYPPALTEFYGYAQPYFTYFDYYIPYSYTHYGYNGYEYDYRYSGSYYSYSPYGYYGYGPGDHEAGYFGDAGTVRVELGNEQEVYPKTEVQDPNFKRTFQPQTYSTGYEVEYAENTPANSSGSNSITVLTPQPKAIEVQDEPAPVVQAQAYVPSCEDVEVFANSVSLKAGEREQTTFYLSNHSFEDFVVDRFNAWTDHPKVQAFEDSFTNKVGTGGSGSLSLTIDALDEAASTQGHVTVYGHFEGGKSCGFNEIKDDFSVSITGQAFKADCQDFKIETPAHVSPQDKHFNVSLTNPFDKEAVVSVTGNGVTVSPETIVLPANSFVEKSIFFEAEGIPQDVRLSASVPGCTILSKIVYFDESETAGFQSALTLNGVPGELSFSSEVNELMNGGYALKLFLANTTSERLSGRIQFVDGRWHLMGDNLITVEPNSTKEVVLMISPDNLINKPTFVPVKFTLANGDSMTTYASFYPFENAIPTAFFTLAQSGVGLGLLVVLLVALIAFYRRLNWQLPVLAPSVKVSEIKSYSAPSFNMVAEKRPDLAAEQPKKKYDDFDEDVYF